MIALEFAAQIVLKAVVDNIHDPAARASETGSREAAMQPKEHDRKPSDQGCEH